MARTVEEFIAKVFSMSDAVWERHANPLFDEDARRGRGEGCQAHEGFPSSLQAQVQGAGVGTRNPTSPQECQQQLPLLTTNLERHQLGQLEMKIVGKNIERRRPTASL